MAIILILILISHRRVESASTASGAGKYGHIVVIDLPQSGSKRSDLSCLRLGAESIEEANEVRMDKTKAVPR